MSNFLKIILWVVGALALLAVALCVYLLIVTNGQPVAKSDLNELSARVDTTAIIADSALKTASGAFDYIVAFGSAYNEHEESTKGFGADLENLKAQIEALKKKTGGVADKKARGEIEKLKNIWLGNITYIAERDSINKVEMQKTRAMLDSVATVQKKKSDPVIDTNTDKKIELPDPGNGQKPPRKGKKKDEKYLPQNNNGGEYNNYHKSSKGSKG